MTRAAGRRIAARPERPPREGPGLRTSLVSLLVVVLAAAALVCAGTADRSTGRQHVAEQTSHTVRTFSCAGGLPGAQAVVGGAGSPVSSARIGSDPLRRTSQTGVAADAFATQVATGRGWLAAEACPEPRAEWWFVGVGGSGTHDSVLTLDNPREGDAVVDIEAFGPRGPVQAPGLQGVTVASGSQVRFDLKKVAPAVGDLAVHVEASRGLVGASATDHWARNVVTKPVSEWVAGQPAADRSLTLAGLPAKADAATLLLANPGQSEAVAQLQVIGRTGTFAPTRHETVRVHPGTVHAIAIDDLLKLKPVAVRVDSQVPVVATIRSVAGRDESYATAAVPLDGPAVTGFPGGSGAVLQLSSLKGTAAGSVRLYAADGSSLGERRLAVPDSGSAQLKLPSRARALSVDAPGGPGDKVVAALLLSPDGDEARGIAAVAVSSAGVAVKVPGVRAAW